ncbi:unnamed protein product [Clonostachys rhizophaga]|uniref:Uncharacterized protein n=1 Tax=Clonostachys rhizophaga TaxID=160324 RepID=A0A9N9YBZ1_9HYPO|nr:unnamed protein product [Clonostachys rhizophaga]
MRIREVFHETPEDSVNENSQGSRPSEPKEASSTEKPPLYDSRRPHCQRDNITQKPDSREIDMPSIPKTHQIKVFSVSDRNLFYCYEAQKWTACLTLETCDLSRLMKEGFYWDKSSIEPESGFFLLDQEDLPENESQWGWKCARVYQCSKMREGIIQWKGQLRILAQELKTLAEFNLDILTADAIHCMKVRDSEERIVYRYCRPKPEESCNAYYDHMPMEGYWPWPKKDEIL